MKISFNWLKDYVQTSLPVEEVARILTDTGLEVEGIHDFESVKGGLKGYVVGEVMECSKHPDADRLSLTKVDVGAEELLDIVCGAPNVALGQKVPVAVVGCEVHLPSGDSFTIKKSKIRGALSQGMICAEDELGLGKGHDGIMVLDTDAANGTPLKEVVSIYEDKVIEIGLTPNRSDAISHIGVARDLVAYLSLEQNAQLQWPELSLDKANGHQVKVTVEASNRCPRYTGIELKNIEVADSPEWLQNRLKAIGLSPINNVVDITNYVMHETGQPLHAFDRDKIGGGEVKVRMAKAGEKFTTLDEVERELDSEDLMIADADKSMCIAGVFGGLDSGVSDTTKAIFLESACFDAVSVRKSNKRHGLNTDSGFRFERGVDPNNPLYALQRAAQLICEVCGAQVDSDITDIYPEKIEPLQVDFDLAACYRLVGQEIPREEVQKILHALDFEVLAVNGNHWQLRVPTYRVDVTRQADVVEEVLRIYGFNRIAIPEQLRNSIVYSQGPDKHGAREKTSLLLNGMGYTEIMCNSLTAASYAALDVDKEVQAVAMLNPLSQDLGILRQTMLWGALESIAYNQNRQMPDFKGFEFGQVYHKTAEGYGEQEKLAIFHAGRRDEENWDRPEQKSSYYDLKAVLEQVLARFKVNTQVLEGADSPEFAQYRVYQVQDRVIARVGMVSGKYLKKFDVKQEVAFGDIDWAYVTKKAHGKKIKVQDIPKFPSARRDLSLLLDKSVEFDQLEKLAKKQAGRMLKEVGLFDVYEGKNLPEGKKSYALSFIIQDPEKTLTDKLVDKLMKKVQLAFEKDLGATLRG